MSNLIGQSLGRYHILEQLGEGGMANVYKAYDTRLERDVAVKVIRKSAFSPEVLGLVLKRFEREAKALARLTHPNIVSIIDYGEYEGSPYLVMPYLPGGTLKQRLGKPIPWQEVIRLILPIARALEFAHGQGIIHRDVKPSNILITLSSEPMLTDFGIAKILETDKTTTLTNSGAAVGTPEYMAPEQWTGHTTSQSDIYSLGVVLYEMVTGRKPYLADTPAAILLKQATEPLPRPGQFVPGLPEATEKVLIKILAKKPEDRYKDMGSLAQALESSSGAERQSAMKNIIPPGEPPVSQPLPTGKDRGKHTGRRGYQWWMIGGAVILLALCGLAIFTFYKAITPTPSTNNPSVPAPSNQPAPTLTTVLLPVASATPQTATSGCTIPGFEGQPTFATTFPNGLADLDALGISHKTINSGQIQELKPGLSLSSDQTGAAYIEFPAKLGGQEFAARLVTTAIYQIALLEDNTTNTWQTAASTLFSLGLHVDHYGPYGQNAGIFYNNGISGWIMVKPQFTPPAGEEINVIFNLGDHQFKVIDSSGNVVYENSLPTGWGNPNNPDKWWFIGDHWTDNIYSTYLQLNEICYKGY